MKRSLLKTIAAASLLLAFNAYAEQTVKIGTITDYAPFEYKDASGKLLGMEIELGNAMCKIMKVKCEYVTMDFDALIPALKAKKIDAVLAQMSITDERKKVVDFTDLFTLAPVQYVTKVGAGITEDPATLKGKIVGVQSGTTHESYMNTRLPKAKSGIDMKIYQSLDQAWLDLESGRVNAVLADTTVAYDWIVKTGKSKGFDYAGKPLVDNVIFGEGTGIAVRKGDPLKASFNKAIKTVLTDGTFAAENKKVFPFTIAPNAAK